MIATDATLQQNCQQQALTRPTILAMQASLRVPLLCMSKVLASVTLGGCSHDVHLITYLYELACTILLKAVKFAGKEAVGHAFGSSIRCNAVEASGGDKLQSYMLTLTLSTHHVRIILCHQMQSLSSQHAVH